MVDGPLVLWVNLLVAEDEKFPIEEEVCFGCKDQGVGKKPCAHIELYSHITVLGVAFI